MSKRNRSVAPVTGAVALGLLALVACDRQKMISNTKIPDTAVNREVLAVVDGYRRAMEREDVARVLMLTHPSYQDDSGTPEPEDDIDYLRLKDVLISRFERTRRIRYRMEFQHVGVKGREALVDVWIDATFLYEQPNASPRYRRFTDHNRYRLIRTTKGWRFVSGI